MKPPLGPLVWRPNIKPGGLYIWGGGYSKEPKLMNLFADLKAFFFHFKHFLSIFSVEKFPSP